MQVFHKMVAVAKKDFSLEGNAAGNGCCAKKFRNVAKPRFNKSDARNTNPRVRGFPLREMPQVMGVAQRSSVTSLNRVLTKATLVI